MTGIVLPLWVPAVAWLAICWGLVLADELVKRRARRRRLLEHDQDLARAA